MGEGNGTAPHCSTTRETVDQFVFLLKRCEIVHHDGGGGNDGDD